MSTWKPRKDQEVLNTKSPEVTLVVASQKKDNTTWLDNTFLHWDKKIYVTDDPDAALTVPGNRGREGMVYLTYITPSTPL